MVAENHPLHPPSFWVVVEDLSQIAFYGALDRRSSTEVYAFANEEPAARQIK
jgi:hypothetical protein